MQEKTAVILMNTGSPAAPTAAALRTYLKDFLSDPRIIELPAWFWQPILRGFILRSRPAKSAERYKKIWLPDGSPLIVYTQALVEKLNEKLPENVAVAMAMRVGAPSTKETVLQLQKEGFSRFLFFPMFAQYATQTTESCLDAIHEIEKKVPQGFTWDWIRPYFDHEGYAQLWADKIRASRTSGAHLVMSFHGIPVKSIEKGSPYQSQCLQTAHMIAEKLGLKEGDYSIAYQSRFGNDHWLQPYLSGHVETLLKKNIRSIDVVCLSFSVDCLESLEEIGLELKEHYLRSGGERFGLIACLNDDEAAVNFYHDLISEALSTMH